MDPTVLRQHHYLLSLYNAHLPTTRMYLLVLEDSLSRDFQPEWGIIGNWSHAASEIVNEQASEERVHPLMISPIVCLCHYRMFTLLTTISGVASLRPQMVRGYLCNPRRASL